MNFTLFLALIYNLYVRISSIYNVLRLLKKNLFSDLRLLTIWAAKNAYYYKCPV